MLFLQLRWTISHADQRYSYVVERTRDYYLVYDKKTGRTLIQLRVRDEYPRTFCVKEESGDIYCGYGQTSSQDDEDFLHVRLSTNGAVTVERDTLSTLPIFYGTDDQILSVSNEYSVVWDNLSRHTLNMRAVTEGLVPDVCWRAHTPCMEISILTERNVMKLENKKLTVLPGPARSWSTSRQAPQTDPHDFMSVLDTHAESVLNRFGADLDKVVFEISGGLDSSFLPLYTGQRYPGAVKHASSFLLTGNFRESHLEKITAIDRYIHAEWLCLPLDDPNYRPMQEAVASHTFRPRHNWNAVFEEAAENYAAALSAKDCRIIFTGYGGDELFDNMPSLGEAVGAGKRGRQRRNELPLPSFFTDVFRKDWVEAAPKLSEITYPQLGVNLHRAIQIQNYFIRHNIWPVSPFANKQLYHFCQGLPVHYRANKNIFRAYYQAKGWPACIYNPRADEHPAEIIQELYMSGYYNELISYFCKYGYTTNNLNYINKYSLREGLRQCFDNTIQDELRDEYFYFTQLWLQTEISIASFLK